MLKDEVNEIAYFAGFSIANGIVTGGAADLNRFAELIESKVEERYKLDGIHSCGPTCTKLACMATREAVAAEREYYEGILVQICAQCRSNEWGPLTHKKEILSWFHDFAAKALDRGEAPE